MTDSSTRLTDRQVYNLAVRLALAWREIRRGASTGPLRSFLYGINDEAIEQGQMDTLDLLAAKPSWRMSDLAEALKVEPSTATRAVQRLEKAGLAQRQASATDGRVVEVLITDAGRSAHREVAERRMELFRHIMGSFDAVELPMMVEMMERFVRSVDEFVATRAPQP